MIYCTSKYHKEKKCFCFCFCFQWWGDGVHYYFDLICTFDLHLICTFDLQGGDFIARQFAKYIMKYLQDNVLPIIVVIMARGWETSTLAKYNTTLVVYGGEYTRLIKLSLRRIMFESASKFQHVQVIEAARLERRWCSMAKRSRARPTNLFTTNLSCTLRCFSTRIPRRFTLAAAVSLPPRGKFLGTRASKSVLW